MFSILCATALFAMGGTDVGPQTTASTETADLDRELGELLAILEEQKVITASGIAVEDREIAAANVFVVSREEISKRGWRSLAEILESSPGLYVIQDLVLPSVGVRGVTGGLRSGTRIVKVMINGVPVNFRPDLTAFVGPEFIPIEAIERVEIAKGPLSALYGANAFLATVNVITRRPGEGVTAELSGRALSLRGRPGLESSGLLAFGGENRGVIASFTIGQNDRSGTLLQPTFRGQDGDEEVFRKTSAGDQSRPAGAFLQFFAGSKKSGTFVLQGGLQQLDAMGEFQLSSVLTHQSRVALQNIWTNGRYERPLSENLSGSVSIGWSQGSPTRDMQLFLTGNNNVSFRPNYGYSAWNAAATAVFTASEKLTINGGVDAEYNVEDVLYYTQTFYAPNGVRKAGDRIDLIGENQPRQQRLYDVGVYLQAASVPVRNLHLTANLRLDKIAQGPAEFPLQPSWRIAAAYRWNEALATKVISGRAFQTPSGVLMFGHPGFGTSNNVVGNLTLTNVKPLRPQVVTSIETVTSARLSESLALEGGAWFQRLDDKIEFTQAFGDFVAANRGVTDSVGLEATARFVWKRFSTYMSASLQRTLVDGELSAAPPPLYPNVFGRVGLNVDLPEVALAANGQARFVGPRGASQSNVYLNNEQPYELPGYVSVDLTLSSVGLHLLGNQQETKFVGSVRNLLDARFFEPGFGGYDIPDSGRVVFVEVRQTF